MTAFLWQVIGMALLFGTIWASWRVWRSRLKQAPSRSETIAALVLMCTLAGGFWGAFAWWQNMPYAFSWRLPNLAARMLAAAGWSFAIASALALWRPHPSHIRLVLWMLWIYLAPLTVAILSLHLDRFDFTREVTVAFFVIVVLLLAFSSFSLLKLPRNIEPSDVATDGLSKSVLRVIGVVAGLWAVALFITPAGPSRVIWSWPNDGLTTRLIASMFLSIAVGALVARREYCLSRTVFWTTIAYAVGINVAGIVHVSTAEPSPMGYKVVALPVSYMAVWGALGFISIMALLLASRTSERGNGVRG